MKKEKVVAPTGPAEEQNVKIKVVALTAAINAFHETDLRPTISDILTTATTFEKYLKGESK